MQALKELYKIGIGPSSSHTIGPERIAKFVQEKYPDCTFKVTLYGSLCFTGKGHGTDKVLKKVLGENTEIIFDKSVGINDLPHPNTLDVFVFKKGEQINRVRAYSIGGGSIKIDGVEFVEPESVYKYSKFTDIKNYVNENGIRL